RCPHYSRSEAKRDRRGSASSTRGGRGRGRQSVSPFKGFSVWRIQAAWRVVAVILILALAAIGPARAQNTPATASANAKYVGSKACQKCHAQIYARWQKTPMANVVRDPREHPDAIIPDLATDTIAKFTKDDVGLVYGSIWKQRYFTKVGNDYYPQPAQW